MAAGKGRATLLDLKYECDRLQLIGYARTFNFYPGLNVH